MLPNILAIQFKVIIQHWCCNSRQSRATHWWYSTILPANTKMGHSKWNLITQTQKLMIASSSLHYDEICNHRLDSFPYPEPIIITFIAYWQLLLMQREPPRCCSNNAKLKHWVTCFHLGLITGCSGGDWLPYRYANHLVPDWSYYRYLLVFHW